MEFQVLKHELCMKDSGRGAALVAPSDRFLIPVAFSKPQPTPAIDLSSVDAQMSAAKINSSANDPGLTVMLGRYVGQIRARIDRAWIRPRAPITSGRFQCRTRIRQGSAGEVLEIELEACNEDPAWQLVCSSGVQIHAAMWSRYLVRPESNHS